LSDELGCGRVRQQLNHDRTTAVEHEVRQPYFFARHSQVVDKHTTKESNLEAA